MRNWKDARSAKDSKKALRTFNDKCCAGLGECIIVTNYTRTRPESLIDDVPQSAG